jgi:hypothetical protein
MGFKCCALPLVFAAAAAASPAAAAGASLWVQAPFDAKTGSFDLDELEYVNWTPFFSMPLHVPYDVLEPLIRDQVKAVADLNTNGHETCPWPCPDVDWTLKIKSDFAFTQKGQPTLQSIGNASENRVKIDLKAQMRVKLQVDVYVDISSPFSDATISLPLEVLIGVHGSSTVKLWPNIVHEGFQMDDPTIDSLNFDIVGLNGALAENGAIAGALFGLTPEGFALGGPIFAVIGAIVGDQSAEAAKKVINKEIKKRLKDALV